jgi:uncharacterized membrane protein
MMSMHPQFLGLLVAMVVLVSILGSDSVPWWRVGAFVVVGFFGLWASSGAYSILGPGLAVDAAGNIIKDMNGRPLYRPRDISSAESFMNATVYFSIACLIAALILGFVKLCSGDIRLRRDIQNEK